MMESESIALPLGHGASTIKIITQFFNKKKAFLHLNTDSTENTTVPQIYKIGNLTFPKKHTT